MWFESEDIKHLKEVYNREHSDKIAEEKPEKIWKELKSKFHDHCKAGSAECIMTSLLTKSVAPATWTANPEEWLSSLDIDKVEGQYHKLFPKYHFVGCVPMDFGKKGDTGQCLVDALCNLKLTELYSKGYDQVGIVFNTDVSTGPGEHWVSLFCDIRPELEYPRITYFDSYAQRPEKEVETLMRRWKANWDATKHHKSPMSMSYNGTRHQMQDSECGMYCLYFHYCCLLGIPMNTRVPDEVVRGLRSMLFRVSKK